VLEPVEQACVVAVPPARSEEGVTVMRECSRFAGRFLSERRVPLIPGGRERRQDAAAPAIHTTGRDEPSPHTRVASELTTLVHWILGFPWVTERAELPQAPGVRWFAVDCEPLDRHRTWPCSPRTWRLPMTSPSQHYRIAARFRLRLFEDPSASPTKEVHR
jgi:hypothetical protein